MIDTTSYLNSKDIAEHWRDIGFVCTLSHIFMDTICICYNIRLTTSPQSYDFNVPVAKCAI